MNKKINTVLFDLDGTLINTNELIIQSFLHTLNHYYPEKYTRETVLPFLGPTLEETFSSIDETRVEEMVQHYRAFNISQHDLLVTEFPYVNETLEALRDNGIKVGIVTTKVRLVVNKGLDLMKLHDLVDCVITLDDVSQAKPHPEPLQKAMEILQSKPEETIMVGDNHHDIEGGKNAKTFTAGVAWSAKGKAYLEQYHPDYMLETMKDLLDILGIEQTNKK